MLYNTLIELMIVLLEYILSISKYSAANIWVDLNSPRLTLGHATVVDIIIY